MALRSWRRCLCRLSALLAAPLGRDPRRQYRPEIEPLELRLAPATLDIFGGALTYTGANVANTLTLSLNSGTYSFNDPSDPITLTAGAVLAGWTPSSGSAPTASGPTASVTSITINMGLSNNNLILGPFDAAIAPVTANGNQPSTFSTSVAVAAAASDSRQGALPSRTSKTLRSTIKCLRRLAR